MKMKINLYFYIIFITALNIIIFCSAKNVLLLSDRSTLINKNCFMKELLNIFKLKKKEQKIPPLENILYGNIGGNNVTLFDLKSFTNNQTENSNMINDLKAKFKFNNISAIDSILLFYSLSDQNPQSIERDFKTLLSTFGKKITKSIALAAINQRRLFGTKRTNLDNLTETNNISYIHIQTLCEDELDREIIIKDFNFIFKNTSRFDFDEPVEIKYERTDGRGYYNALFFLLCSLSPFLIFYVYRVIKLENIRKNSNSIHKDKDKEKRTPNIDNSIPIDEEIEKSYLKVERDPKKEEIKKELDDILNNLQVELFEDECQQEANNSKIIEPIEAEPEKKREENPLDEISLDEVESIQASDSDGDINDKIEKILETKAKPIVNENQEIITKNDWEFLN